MVESQCEKNAALVLRLVEDFWAQSSENSLQNGTGEKAWERPLVGFSRGDDPLFARYAHDLAPFYWPPAKAFALAFPETPVTAAELSVISWILPQTARTRADQKACTQLPAERWARSRDLGEGFNCSLRRYLAEALKKKGFAALAPERLAAFDYQRSERFGIASNWSERHTAHVAGLGTFGLSDGLITPQGKAVRIGSVVARMDLPASRRAYTGHQDWCLWFARGTCGACIKRCPAGAISAAGHDKDKCRKYIRETTAPYAQKRFGTQATPCGLCQVGIPCEAKIPLQP